MKNKIIVLTLSLIILALYLVNSSTIPLSKSKKNENSKVAKQNTQQVHYVSKLKKKALIEPSLAQTYEKKSSSVQQQKLPLSLKQQRQKLKEQLMALLHCTKTHSCPVDNSDSRASDLLLGQKVTELLDKYRELHQENDFYDDETAAMVKEFLNNQDGYVQESALNLMSVMPANSENAQVLINTLQTSYDAKIMAKALKELVRYPQLNQQIEQLLTQSLKTGSFYVGQEVALNILPYLSAGNLQHYIGVANSLPQNSQKAKALWSNINEFKLRLSHG